MKKIIITCIILTLFACDRDHKIELPIGENIYEIKYPSDWKKDDKEWLYYKSLLSIEKPNPKSSPHGPFAFGSIHILTSEKDKNGLCAGFFTESNFEENDEGPESYVKYKKDQVLINGKYADRWVSDKEMIFTEVFFGLDDKNCIRFALVPSPGSNNEEVEKDFYSIIKSFHQVKR